MAHQRAGDQYRESQALPQGHSHHAPAAPAPALITLSDGFFQKQSYPHLIVFIVTLGLVPLIPTHAMQTLSSLVLI